MKRRIIILAMILLALALMGFRFMVVEREDALPDAVRLGWKNLFGRALAETGSLEEAPPAGEETPVPTEETPDAARTSPEDVPAEELPGEAIPGDEAPDEAEEDILLAEGDRGEEVKRLQERLNELGFSAGAADGKYGPKTGLAVEAFRKHLYELEGERAARDAEAARLAEEERLREEAGISPDIPGAEEAPAAVRDEDKEAEDAANEATEATTEDTKDNAGEEASQDAAGPAFVNWVDGELYRLLLEGEFDGFQEKLAPGDRGAEVRRLQDRLKALGYLSGAADGIYGGQTKRAVAAFQKRNDLSEDGLAGEDTQRTLYSGAAKKQVRPAKPYLLKVDTSKQRVYAYAWSEGDGAYTKLARTMVCSTGLNKTPTPHGTFSGTGPVARWGYFPKFKVWAQYLYRINGAILFHSVLYNGQNENSVIQGSVYKLGSRASHGCVRLSVEDAKWIFNNCPAGTTVKVV